MRHNSYSSYTEKLVSGCRTKKTSSKCEDYFASGCSDEKKFALSSSDPDPDPVSVLSKLRSGDLISSGKRRNKYIVTFTDPQSTYNSEINLRPNIYSS